MKQQSLVISGLALLLTTSICEAQTVRRWDFDRTGDQENWTFPTHVRGVVKGGSLWLSQKPEGQAEDRDLALSPSGLRIPATDVTQVRLRVLNLSSLTDFYLRWKTIERLWGFESLSEAERFNAPKPPHSRRCTLKADRKEWQEITCYIDQRWQGTIDQIVLGNAKHAALRGDLRIDWIEIVKGDPEPVRPRPDVASSDVVPNVSLPGISQQGFHDAFRVLDDCLIVDVPFMGFTYPFMSPGGHYKEAGWFQLDSSLTVMGAKWANQHFVEDVMRGFRDVQAQNADGHISMMAGLFGEKEDEVSSLPVFFEVAYDVARRTNDKELRAEIYESMRKYLDWWLSPVKRDGQTELVTGYWEETFGDPDQAPHITGKPWAPGKPKTVAPVDLNVIVAVGAARTAELAAALDKTEEASRYRRVFEELSRAINTYLWDDQEGAYHNYDLRTGQLRPGLIVSTFDPLRLGIAPGTRRDRLLKRLLDPTQFNWGKRPLTTWAMTDPGYIEAKVDTGHGAWWGDVWTLPNMNVVAGLEESGRPDLAAELNWATINEFHSNYREFILPSTGEGRGAKNYGWSASQYIGAIIEHLFGVDFDRIQKRLKIAPHVPEALYGQDLAIENLVLQTGGDTRLSLSVKQTAAKAGKVMLRISGPPPEGFLQITLPGGTKQVTVPVQPAITVEFP